MEERQQRSTRPAGALSGYAGMMLYGLIGGALLGAVDFALGVSEASRFLRTPPQWIAHLAFSVVLYGLTVSMAALAGRALLGLTVRMHLVRALASLWNPATSWRTAAAYSFSLSLGGVVFVAAFSPLSLWLTQAFNHKGLVAVVTSLLALALLGGIGAFCLFAAGFLCSVQRLIGLRPLPAKVLSLTLPAIVIVGALVAATLVFWETSSNLPLRKLAVLSAAALLLTLIFFLPPLRLRRPGFMISGVLAGAALLAQLLSISENGRKAAESSLSLARDLMSAGRRAVDLDLDGYSALFGGGDCNDLDSGVHPGAFDWPDDGVDQNCLGGDARVKDRKALPQFPVPPEVPEDLNVLLITVDALTSLHVGSYGYKRDTTPNLDRFAGGAVLFEKSFAHAPSTRYSFPTLMTARYPASIRWGEGSWPPPVNPENFTFAEAMKKLGLHTAAILNYRFFKEEWGLNQGFDHYDNSRSVLHHGKSDPATHGISSDAMADAAIQYLDGLGDKRFFLWVHFYDPHWYYETHPGFSIFGDSRVDLYDGEVRFTDHHMGRLLDHVAGSDLAKNTVIIVTGDHGEGFGEHGIELHGYHLYNPQTFVPLIIKVPGIPATRVSADIATHVDILPTVVNLLGGEVSPEFQGGSLLDLMTGSPAYRRVRFQEVWYADRGPFTRMVSALTRDWKLIFNEQPSGTFELYDLNADMAESTDLWSLADPALEKSLSDAVIRHMEEDHLPLDFHERIAPMVSNTAFADCPANVHAVFGKDSEIELLGSRLEELPAEGGRKMRITTWWKVNKAPGSAWKLFMHIKPEKGAFINADHEPVEGFMPVERWLAGQHLKDVTVVTVPQKDRNRKFSVLTGFFSGTRRMEARVLKGTGADKTGGVFIGTIDPLIRSGNAIER